MGSRRFRYVKLDVDYFGNPKVRRAGRDGMLLHLASVAHSGRFLTDGRLSVEAVNDIVRSLQLRRDAVGRVVEAGLWLPVDDEWVVHDFVAMNGTRAEVEDRIDRNRKGGAERQRRFRERHAAGGDDGAL